MGVLAMFNRLQINIFLGIILLAVSIYSLVIPHKQNSLICSDIDPKDCYPKSFVPTDQWQVVREGQEVPAGLDFSIDLEKGIKLAKLIEPEVHQTSSVNIKDTSEDTAAALKEAIKEAPKKVVSNYDSEDVEEDSDITALKMAVQGAETQIDVKDALVYITSTDQSDEVLKSSLDSLTDHSHNLKDGVLISQPQYFDRLVELATDKKHSIMVQEMSSRVIAQSLRHNPKALENVQITQVLPKFLAVLQDEDNSVLQKRILGVISSLVQSEVNVAIFKNFKGESILLDNFSKFKEDSKIRALEILEDVKKYNGLQKRSNEDDLLNSKIFKTIQDSLSNNEISDDHNLEKLFDKAVELKSENKHYKTDSQFLQWLSKQVEDRKLNKRDSDYNDELHKKLLEARHVVFGNPNALRKAFVDEL
ncbi:Nucleotide exchange factor SIL1 [Wickerhamomyces ciferrii]|uniref:Nucleotide exchange factor SIL1 n=1 Tax=Wickerhamomyces ciferrii (strain ATCC 14091 / BCRC 22168 / CBS 111 / JCM 3599 / NBRC 0793 / NRRL Y-1031 F-60-10) TaxID=1206466 RepID=K0KCA2_WICCF|nr:Nucleotide exchange factor SIL1 [Wickerhamomyces ciferrii]CCH40526.1 Nucleotide exchange factor SIL1 [Wickerhamomyces ciferrii]